MSDWDDPARGPWAPPSRRTVVVAPHPDDETLATAGLVLHQLAAGVPVTIVAVTDGEAAYPEVGPDALAACRRAEQVEALRSLGVDEHDIIRLGLPDGAVADHEDRLATQLAAIVRPGDLLVAPWTGDHHTDHEACGRAAVRAAAVRQADLVGSLVWAPIRTPSPPPTLLALALDDEMLARRGRALCAHRSQLEGVGDCPPIVDDELLDRSRLDEEWYVPMSADTAAPVERTSAAFFEAMYRMTPDPWRFGSDDTEQDRYADILARLGPGDLGAVLEPACSIGVLTAQLAARASSVRALDVSPTAVAAAQRRSAAFPHVTVTVGRVPDDLPDDVVDVVVFAELGYYFDIEGLDAALDAIAARLRPGGRLVATHWTGRSSDHVLDAETVHDRIDAHPDLEVVARHDRPTYLLQEWRRRDRTT